MKKCIVIATERIGLRLGIGVLIGTLLLSGAPIYALTTDQVHSFNSSVPYFNTEVDCGGVSSSNGGSGTPLSGSDHETQAFNYFLAKGLSPIATTAVVGNLMEESHMDPTIAQTGGDTKDPSQFTHKLEGWGIAQWDPGAKITGIASSLHISGPIYELSTQLDIVWAEMTGSAPTGFQDVASGLKQKTTLGTPNTTDLPDTSTAVGYFQKNFEGGANYNARVADAQAVWVKLGAHAQAGGSSTGGSSSSSSPDPTLPSYCSSNSTATAGNGTDLIWLESGPGAEFDGVCDGCKDPKTGITSFWISGQCSQASLAEVLNAYDQGKVLKNSTYTPPGSNKGISLAPSTGGTYYKTIDIERLSYTAGVWNGAFDFKPSIDASWGIEAGMFNMDVSFYDLHGGSGGKGGKITADNNGLQTLINIANAGTPVITDAPNHWLVIIGGDDTNIFLLDSSGNNETWAPASTKDSITISRQPYHVHNVLRTQFLKGLAGFQTYWGSSDGKAAADPTAVILTPKAS